MLRQAKIGDPGRLDTILQEYDELCRIISASKKTAESRLK
jgi:hypothetical protein